MYKVEFTDNSSMNIDNFVDGYLNSFLNLFTDTGLFEEDTIKNTYIDNSLKFQKNIYVGVNDLLIQETILGYSVLENKNLEITLIVGNYRLFVEYGEDSDQKLKFIENIRFINK